MFSAVPPARLTIALGLLLAVLVLGGPVPGAARADGIPAKPEVLPTASESVEGDSPRACVADFLSLCHRGRCAEAAKYLDVLPARIAEGPELARRLVAVLDRRVWIDLEDLSPRSEGKLDDRLPRDTDEVARLSTDASLISSIRIARRESPEGARWLFTRGTVEQINRFYDTLEDRWLRENLPEPLLRPGPRGLLWWQWLALPLLALAGFAFGRGFALLARKLIGPLVARTRTPFDDEMLVRLRGPLTMIGALLAVQLLIPALDLYRPAVEFLRHVVRAGVLAALFWILLRTVDIGAQLIRGSPWAKANPTKVGMLPLGVRLAQLGVLSVAAIAVLSELGFQVASLLAGLGIGGLALALAARKTMENLFGSMSITIDQPFAVGDVVKIEEIIGTVEAVGLRSTRVRTLERTLVAFPNGQLADQRIENLSARDRIRMAATLGLVYATTAAQMRSVLLGAETYLKGHGRVAQDSLSVRFARLGDASLDVDVIAYFLTADWNEFLTLRQEALLQLLEIVEKAGTQLAYPTQEVHLVTRPESPATAQKVFPAAQS
jgi:MscS family membrane protein